MLLSAPGDPVGTAFRTAFCFRIRRTSPSGPSFVSLSLPLQSSDNVQRLELEDGWEILVDPSGRLFYQAARNAEGWRAVRVGLSWNVQYEDLRDYMGAAWYWLRFELPAFRDTRHVLLKFGAVDYFCEVFINGVSIGTHEGGYTPFSFEITSAIHPGANELMIRVSGPQTRRNRSHSSSDQLSDAQMSTRRKSSR